MIVNINVKGSCILYLENNIWNVVFITDDCHDVRFKDPIDTKERPLGKSDRQRQIEFVSSGSAASSNPIGFSDFFNLADYHNNGLRINPKPDCGRQYIEMKIPYGTLVAGSRRHKEYLIWEIGTGQPIRTGKYPATRFTIRFDSASDVEMILDDMYGIEKRTYRNNMPVLDLDFDNFCDISQGYNDFIHVYDWIEDARDSSKRFLAGTEDAKFEDPGGCPPELSSVRKTMGVDGDCDPIVIEPPPGPLTS